MSSRVRSMKLVFSDVMVILGFLFERNNEVEEEPIMKNEVEMKKKGDDEGGEDNGGLNNQM